MSDAQRSMLTQQEMDARYVRIESPEYQQLKTKVDNWSSSSARVERYLIGGIDDNGKYTVGMGTWFKAAAFVGSLAATAIVAIIVALVTHQGRLW